MEGCEEYDDCEANILCVIHNAAGAKVNGTYSELGIGIPDDMRAEIDREVERYPEWKGLVDAWYSKREDSLLRQRDSKQAKA